MLYLFLLAYTSLIGAALHTTTPSETIWEESSSSGRFAPLIHVPVEVLPNYRDQLVPYLIARGVKKEEEAAVEAYFRRDLQHIAEALSILFEQNVTEILHKTFGRHSSLIEGHSVKIDHVGIELYGPIAFYLPIIREIACEMDLVYASDLLFPSTQVVKVLQKDDPDVRGVTIGRVYLQSESKARCIELFQASLMDGQHPQRIAATERRLALLTATEGSSNLSPIDHISIELSSVEEVEQVHHKIYQLACETLHPYQKDVSYNAGDGSTQTKVLIRTSSDTPFNRVVEFVHYSTK